MTGAADDFGTPGVTGSLSIGDNSPCVTCQCGARSYGDSLSDAVNAWASHIVKSACREGL